MTANTLASSPSGKYSAGGVNATMNHRLTPVTTTMQATHRRALASRNATEFRVSSRQRRPMPAWSAELLRPRDRRAAAVGSTVIATSIEARIAAAIATATSE